MKEIPLTKGKKALVDDEDFELLSENRWQVRGSGGRGYAKRHIRVAKRDVTMAMHRVILAAKPDQQVDHIDGNGLNNQKANLRFATQSENLCNRDKKKTNKTGFKGVKFDSRYGTWSARVGLNKKQFYLGSFNTALEAAQAYNEAAIRLHGDFVRLNRV